VTSRSVAFSFTSTTPGEIEFWNVLTRGQSALLSVPEEHTFRCEDCDELFQSKLDLRRHKKYACSAVSSLYDTLNDEIKQEGLGDGQVFECKDCERMFPNKYRYGARGVVLWALPLVWQRGAGWMLGGSGHSGSAPCLPPARPDRAHELP